MQAVPQVVHEEWEQEDYLVFTIADIGERLARRVRNTLSPAQLPRRRAALRKAAIVEARNQLSAILAELGEEPDITTLAQGHERVLGEVAQQLSALADNLHLYVHCEPRVACNSLQPPPPQQRDTRYSQKSDITPFY